MPAADLDFTTLVAVDDRHLKEWRTTWPTWRQNRPQLLEHPLLVVCDGARPLDYWQTALEFVDHPDKRYLLWNGKAESQREKMLAGFVFAARYVRTAWYLKLDVDVVAWPTGNPIDGRWFRATAGRRVPVFVASPWSYTKPADWINKLEVWSARTPGLSEHPAVIPTPTASQRRHRHRRIISYCFFGDTAWTVAMASLCDDDRLPVPSHDTFLWYCAARRGDFYRTAPMKDYGWQHVATRRLAATARAALQSSTDASQERTPMPARAAEVRRLALSIRRDKPVLKGVEIGVAFGQTSESLLRSINDLHLTMVDAWATYDSSHPYRLSGDACARLTQVEQDYRADLARRRTEFADSRRVILRTDGRSASETFRGGEVDFVFIDADHTYEGVRRDIEAWWPKVRSGGILCGHDYQSRRDRRGVWGVTRAVNEFAADQALRVCAGPGNVWSVQKPEQICRCENVNAGHTSGGEQQVTSDCGVMYLLTGPAHSARLVTSLMSLREHWHGPVVLHTTQPISDEIGRLIAADRRLSVEHRVQQQFPGRRSSTFLTKIDILRNLPFERTVYLDCDTLVVGGIAALFQNLAEKALCVTQFSNWTTAKRVIRRRVEAWRRVRPPQELKDRFSEMVSTATVGQPAINVGVFGVRRAEPVVDRWLKLAAAGRKTFICDEIALQLLLPQEPHALLDCRYNCSPYFARSQEDVRIWHFHGDKHLRHDQGRALWLPAFHACLDKNFASIKSWANELNPDLRSLD